MRQGDQTIARAGALGIQLRKRRRFRHGGDLIGKSRSILQKLQLFGNKSNRLPHLGLRMPRRYEETQSSFSFGDGGKYDWKDVDASFEEAVREDDGLG